MLSVAYSEIAARNDVRNADTNVREVDANVKSHSAPNRVTAPFCDRYPSANYHVKQAFECRREIGRGGRPPRSTFQEERRIVEHYLEKHKEGHLLSKVQLFNYAVIPIGCYWCLLKALKPNTCLLAKSVPVSRAVA